MAYTSPDSISSREGETAQELIRRIRMLNADNTVESLTAAAQLAPPSPMAGTAPSPMAGTSPIADQRTGERSRFIPTAAQQAEMDRAIAATATQNAALKGGGGFQSSLDTRGGSVAGSGTLSAGTIGRRLGEPSQPLGGFQSSLSTQGKFTPAAGFGGVKSGFDVGAGAGTGGGGGGGGTTVRASDGSLTVAPATVAPAPQRLPAPPPVTELPSTPIDAAQRAGERSSAPAVDMDALRKQAADAAAAVNAANATRGTTTTGGGTVQPPIVPPVVPPTPPTTPLVDGKTTSDLLAKMTTAQNTGGITARGTAAGTQLPTAGTGAAGTGANTQLPGGGAAAGGTASSAQLQQSIMSDLQGIREQISRGPQAPDVMATFMVQGKSILDMLDRQIADLQAEGSTIDPMTQNTLDTLREQLGEQLKATKEALNARGLLDSGILIEAEQMLRKGNLSDQAKILGERLSRIQQSVQSIRGQKANVASDWAMAGVKGQTQADLAERDRIERLGGRMIDTETGLYNSAQRSEEAAAQRQFEAEQNDLQRRYAMAAKNAEIAAQAQDHEAQRNWELQKMQIAAELDASTARASTTSRSSGGTARSTSGTANGATPEENTQDTIDNMFETFATRREAEAALSDPDILRELQAHGVDIGKVIDAARGLGERRAGTSDY